MIGADALQVPSAHQSLSGMGSKQISDLIGEDVNISWTGTSGSVSGEIKYVDDYSELYGESEKSGNFFPFVLDGAYKGKDITVQRTGGKAKTANDTEWILRLTDKASTKYTITYDGKEIAKLSFDKATLKEAPSA